MIELLEEFRPIPGTGERYFVSNKGNIVSAYARRNVRNHKSERFMPRPIRATDNGRGYLVFHTRIDNQRKSHYVHRVVADAFLPKVEGKDYVNHIDYDTHNNDVSNLEWCTQKENIHHSKCHCPKMKRYKTATGERYISKKGMYYRVCFNNSLVKADSVFKTLDEAISFRDGLLHEIGYSI